MKPHPLLRLYHCTSPSIGPLGIASREYRGFAVSAEATTGGGDGSGIYCSEIADFGASPLAISLHTCKRHKRREKVGTRRACLRARVHGALRIASKKR